MSTASRSRAVVAACAIGLMFGCTDTQPRVTTTETDPIQQEIEAKVKSKGPVEVPPGYMINSGGELVPVEEPSEDQ